jgi:glycosyltransferase involved in cell wall biosynthesis
MTPAAPVVTVVIPTYNRAGMIGRAIASVLAQTFRDFELIVADDASTDDTERVVLAFGDPRIVYLRRENNGGNAAARNLGVFNARGRYVAFLDSDDEFLPEFLATVTKSLDAADDSVGFVWVRRAFVDAARGGAVSLPAPRPSPPPDDLYRSLLHRFRGGTSEGLTVRRRCFDVVGMFDERFRSAVDTDFVLRLAQRFQGREIPEYHVRFHQHDDVRAGSDSGHRASAYSILIDRHRAAIQSDAALWTYFHNRTGRLHYQAGDRSEGRRCLVRSLRRRPLQVRTWILLLSFELFGRRGGAWYAALSEGAKKRLRPSGGGQP